MASPTKRRGLGHGQPQLLACAVSLLTGCALVTHANDFRVVPVVGHWKTAGTNDSTATVSSLDVALTLEAGESDALGTGSATYTLTNQVGSVTTKEEHDAVVTWTLRDDVFVIDAICADCAAKRPEYENSRLTCSLSADEQMLECTRETCKDSTFTVCATSMKNPQLTFTRVVAP